MKINHFVAAALTFSLATSAMPAQLFAGQQNGTISGTAKNEAKKPFGDYSVRARNAQNGQVAETTPLDANASFSLSGLAPASYLVELLNQKGKVVCTEGPFSL